MNVIKKGWFIILLCLCVHADEGALYHEAQVVLNNLHTSSYSYTFYIDETEGIYETTCSSFISFLVQKVSQEAFEPLPVDTKRKQPLARNYYVFFNALKEGKQEKYWRSVRYLKEVQVGDIIAWKYDPSLGKKDTGHVVMVYEKPIQEADGRYRIRVIDSSKGTHANDTRSAHPQGGIGTGEMWFVPDEKGEIKGFYWSNRSPKMSQHALAIGRIIIPSSTF